MAKKILVVAASSVENLVVRKGDLLYLRRPDSADMLMDKICEEPEDTIDSLCSKHDFLPVVGEDGEANPEIDDDDYPFVEQTEDDLGEEVFQIVARYKTEGAGNAPGLAQDASGEQNGT